MPYASIARCWRLASFALLTAVGAGAAAATFGVSPLKLELGGSARSAIVTVSNHSSEPLVLAVEAVGWSMTEDGTEKYAPTEDLLFYPKALSVPAGEKRVVRVAAQAPAGTAEKTYRLFLRETQDKSAAPGLRAGVTMLVNFGVPVFLKTPGSKPNLVGSISVSAGALLVSVSNVGTSRARIESVSFSGEQPRPHGTAYVLAGQTRTLNLSLSPADCTGDAQKTLEVATADREQVLKLAADLTALCK